MRKNLKAIVLVDENWGIGSGGEQNLYIRKDMERFKELTEEKTVIVGRKTMLTFPNRSPLAKRKNLVLSSNANLRVGRNKVCPDMFSVFSSITPTESVFVVGGAQVYETFLPYCNMVYVTKVMKEYPADAYFPNLDEAEDWEVNETSEVMEENDIHFQYVTYMRKES